jgi:hypothetical protein
VAVAVVAGRWCLAFRFACFDSNRLVQCRCMCSAGACAVPVRVQCGLDGKFTPPDWVGSPPPKGEHAHLRVMKDGTLVTRIALGKNAFVLVGRVATCDVVAEHRSISRQHAVVGWDALGTLYVQDLDTSWGTFVDDAKAHQRATWLRAIRPIHAHCGWEGGRACGFERGSEGGEHGSKHRGRRLRECGAAQFLPCSVPADADVLLHPAHLGSSEASAECDR